MPHLHDSQGTIPPQNINSLSENGHSIPNSGTPRPRSHQTNPYKLLISYVLTLHSPMANHVL